MSAAEPNTLPRECRIFCRYLVGRPPDEYILNKYLEAHRVAPEYTNGSRFDRLLVDIVTSRALSASCADSYACLFARRSLLRRKLILLLAILESCAPARGFLDAIEPVSRFRLALTLLGRGILFLIRVVFAALFLLPLQVVLGGSQAAGEQV